MSSLGTQHSASPISPTPLCQYIAKMKITGIHMTLLFAAAAMAAPASNTNLEFRAPEAANPDGPEARDCPGSSICLGGQCRSFQCIGGGPNACGYYPIGVAC